MRVHLIAALFQTISPSAQRNALIDQHCGMLGICRSVEVHRFDMHAPERSKSNRTALGAHAIAIACKPPFAHQRHLFCCRFELSGVNSAGVLHVCARLLRSADGALSASNWSSSFRQEVSIFSVPRYQAATGSTRIGCQLAHDRRDAIGHSRSVAENEISRNGTRTHHRAVVQDSDGYDSETARG